MPKTRRQTTLAEAAAAAASARTSLSMKPGDSFGLQPNPRPAAFNGTMMHNYHSLSRRRRGHSFLSSPAISGGARAPVVGIVLLVLFRGG